MTPRADAARASSSKARSACARRTRTATGVLLFTGHFGFWEINALVHALALQPMAVLARPLDNPLLHDLLESVADATGNSVIYRRGAIRRVLRALERQPGGRRPDRSAHPDRRRGLRRLLQPARGDDLGAGGAGAAHRRAGHSGVRAAAAGRPLPDGLRARRRAAARRRSRRASASSRSAAPTCSRCTCGAIRSCGCGCTAAGATSSRRTSRSPRHVPGRRAAKSEREVTSAVGREHRAVTRSPSGSSIRAPNWLGDAVMALPAMARGARARFREAHARRRGDSVGRAALRRGDAARAQDSDPDDRSRTRGARSCSAGGFDAILLLPNSFRTAWTARRGGDRRSAGATRPASAAGC